MQGLEDLVELTLKTGPRILDCSSRNIGARLEIISRIVSNTFVALSGSFPRFLFDLERIIATAAADIAKKVTLRNMDKLLTGGKARVMACHGRHATQLPGPPPGTDQRLGPRAQAVLRLTVGASPAERPGDSGSPPAARAGPG